MFYDSNCKKKAVSSRGDLKNIGGKIMKKLIKVLMISMLALTLVACGGTGTEGTDGDKGKTYEVGVVIYQFNDNFMTLYCEEIQAGFKDAAAKDGNTYNVDVQDSKNDQANQTEQVRNFITQQ